MCGQILEERLVDDINVRITAVSKNPERKTIFGISTPFKNYYILFRLDSLPFAGKKLQVNRDLYDSVEAGTSRTIGEIPVYQQFQGGEPIGNRYIKFPRNKPMFRPQQRIELPQYSKP